MGMIQTERPDREDPNQKERARMRETPEGHMDQTSSGPHPIKKTAVHANCMFSTQLTVLSESSRENGRYDIEQYHKAQNKQQIIKSRRVEK